MTRLWRWLRDARTTARTRRAIRERECPHDGTDPMCDRCALLWNPPP